MPQPNTAIYPRYGRGELNSPSHNTGNFPLLNQIWFCFTNYRKQRNRYFSTLRFITNLLK